MSGKIIISSSLQKRVEAIVQELRIQSSDFRIEENNLPSHPDLLYTQDDEKLGVEKTKEIRKFLTTKPFQSDKKVLIIESAENLTIDAQNSLLKLLEEPPGESIILLGVDSEQSLLPTILSRCQIEYLLDTPKTSFKYAQKIEELPSKTLEERFEFIEKLTEREVFLDEMLRFYRLKMHQDPGLSGWVKELLKASEYKKGRVTIRLILEYLMFQLPKES